MNYRKQKMIPIILVSLACLLFIIAIILLLNTDYFEFRNKITNQESNHNQVIEEKEEVSLDINDNNSNNFQNNDDTNQENINIENNEHLDADNDTVETKEELISENNSNNQNESIFRNEMDVISYFESQDSMIGESVNQDDISFRDKAKKAFVTVVDFIFYGKEIKGYTFNELTTNTKLKVIEVALSIDYKIDKYFPDYKDVIKDKYTNIKGKLAVQYLEFTSTLCETVGEDTCHQAQEDFNTMKESFSITWELIKELASSGSTKVKEFYESWRDTE